MVERRPPKPEVEGSSPSSPAGKIMKTIRTYFNNVKLELKKVTWLTKQEMLGSTWVVWIFAFILCIFLFVADFSMSGLMSKLLGVESGE